MEKTAEEKGRDRNDAVCALGELSIEKRVVVKWINHVFLDIGKD